MYHNGIEVGLSIEYALLAPNGRWAVVPSAQEDDLRNKIKIYLLGRIPFGNIVEYDLEGDEHYPIPHIYCHYPNGGPYERFAGEIVDSPYKERRDPQLKVKFEEIIVELSAKNP